VLVPASSASVLSPDGLRRLRAIGELPTEERETCDLVGVQDRMQTKAAEVFGVLDGTVEWQLSRGLQLAAEQMADLRPGETAGLGPRACRQVVGPLGVGVLSRSRLEEPSRGCRFAGATTA
jgi:hypothetical protein